MALKKKKRSRYRNNIHNGNNDRKNHHRLHDIFRSHNSSGITEIKKKKVICTISLFLLVFLSIGTAAYFLEGHLSLAGILNDRFAEEDDEVDSVELSLYDEIFYINNKYDTFLLIGTDYSGNEEGEDTEYQGSLADFLMLMIIDHTEKTYAFLPIDRNTMADVHLLKKDGSGNVIAEEQINTAHWYGGSKEMGCENTVTAVSDYLGGLPIDGYYSISMSEIPRINHVIGGVTVTLKDDFSKMDPAMVPGSTLTLSDEQAEIYIRSRMSLEDDTNKNRMARQQTYLSEAMKKIKTKLKEDPDYFEVVSNEFSDAATSSITGRQTSRVANALIKYKDLGTFVIEGKTKLGYALGDGIEHEEFYPDPDSVIDVMTKLYNLEKQED